MSYTCIACSETTMGIFLGKEKALVLLFEMSEEQRDVFLYSLGSTITMVSLSSICFLSSCIFNKTRLSITVGGGINIFFFICSILSFFGSEALTPTIRIEAMGYFRYFTIMSLNNGVCVMNSNLTLFIIELICLLLISVGCYIGGIVIFNKKDLPL